MPILAIFTGKGLTKQMYESMRPEVNWETTHPPGIFLHACAFDDAGDIHVVDVWESADALHAFVNTRLAPVMQKLGFPAPQASVFPLHNLNLYPASQTYLMK